MSTLSIPNTKDFKDFKDEAVAAPVEVREGDWQSYSRQRSRPVCGAELAPYQGKRAQMHRAVCSRTPPRILTPQCIADLEKANRAQRYLRYPWLEKLVIAEHKKFNNIICAEC